MQLQDRRQLLISGRVAVLAAVFITSSDKRTDKNTTPTLSRSLDRGNQCARSPTIEIVLLRLLAELSHKNRWALLLLSTALLRDVQSSRLTFCATKLQVC